MDPNKKVFFRGSVKFCRGISVNEEVLWDYVDVVVEEHRVLLFSQDDTTPGLLCAFDLDLFALFSFRKEASDEVIKKSYHQILVKELYHTGNTFMWIQYADRSQKVVFTVAFPTEPLANDFVNAVRVCKAFLKYKQHCEKIKMGVNPGVQLFLQTLCQHSYLQHHPLCIGPEDIFEEQDDDTVLKYEAIMTFVQQMRTLQRIQFADIPLDGPNTNVIINILTAFPPYFLSHLTIRGCQLGVGQMGQLKSILNYHVVLSHLDLSHNHLDDACLPTFSDCLVNLPYLIHLDLSHNRFRGTSPSLWEDFFDNVSYYLTHFSLDLSDNLLQDDLIDTLEICVIQAKESQVQSLCLDRNRFSDQGLHNLMKSMLSQPSLSPTQPSVLQFRQLPLQQYFVNCLRLLFQNKKQLQMSIQKRTNPRLLPCTSPEAIESNELIYKQIDQMVASNAESPLSIEQIVACLQNVKERSHQMLVPRLDPLLDLLHEKIKYACYYKDFYVINSLFQFLDPFLISILQVQGYQQLVMGDASLIMQQIQLSLNLQVPEHKANRRLYELGLLTIKKDIHGPVQNYLLELIEERNKQIRRMLQEEQIEQSPSSNKVVLFLDRDIEQVGRQIPASLQSAFQSLLKHPSQCDYYSLLRLTPRQLDTERKKADVFQQKKQNYFNQIWLERCLFLSRKLSMAEFRLQMKDIQLCAVRLVLNYYNEEPKVPIEVYSPLQGVSISAGLGHDYPQRVTDAPAASGKRDGLPRINDLSAMINQVKGVELIEDPAYQEIASEALYNLLHLIVHEYKTCQKHGGKSYRALADEAYSQILAHVMTLDNQIPMQTYFMRVVELLACYIDTSELSLLRYTVDATCDRAGLVKPRCRIYRNLFECYKYPWWPSKYEVHQRLFDPNQALVVHYQLFLCSGQPRSVPIADHYLKVPQLLALVLQDCLELRQLEFKECLWLYCDHTPLPSHEYVLHLLQKHQTAVGRPLCVTLQFRIVPIYIMNNYVAVSPGVMSALTKQMLQQLVVSLGESQSLWREFFELQVMAQLLLNALENKTQLNNSVWLMDSLCVLNGVAPSRTMQQQVESLLSEQHPFSILDEPSRFRHLLYHFSAYLSFNRYPAYYFKNNQRYQRECVVDVDLFWLKIRIKDQNKEVVKKIVIKYSRIQQMQCTAEKLILSVVKKQKNVLHNLVLEGVSLALHQDILNQQVQSLLENKKLLYLNKFFASKVLAQQNEDLLVQLDLFSGGECGLLQKDRLLPSQKSLAQQVALVHANLNTLIRDGVFESGYESPRPAVDKYVHLHRSPLLKFCLSLPKQKGESPEQSLDLQ